MAKVTSRIMVSAYERVRWGVGTLTAMAVLGLALPVQAKTFRCGAGDVTCLVAAINEANANGETNTIRLAAGTYTLTTTDNSIDGPNGLPSVTSSLTIRGAGAESTAIARDASAPAFRLLHVEAPGVLTVEALTLQGGSAVGPAFNSPGNGGGIFNGGTLIVRQTTLKSNNATGNSISAPVLTPFDTGNGGGIFSSGTLTVTHSTLTGNVATGYGADGNGGGIFSSGPATVTHSTLTGNTGFANSTGNSGNGGGIYASGTLTVTESILDHNTATGAGGHSSGSGGGIYGTGPMTVTDSTLTRNQAGHPGTAGGYGTGGGIFSNGPLTVTHSTLSGNGATSSGGGAYGGSSLTVTNSIVSDNTLFGSADSPGSGGGLAGGSTSGTLTVMHSTISGNTILRTFDVVVAGGAGIIFGGTVTVMDSTVSGNTGMKSGGGIFLFSGTLTVINTTVSGNSTSSSGGGIFSQGTLTRVINSTVSGNVANQGGGIANGQSSGPLLLNNTVVAGNTPTGTGPDCVGPITSLGNNVIGDATGCAIALQPSDRTGDPGLEAFADDGKPGNGHFSLLPTSQAIDAGSEALCPATDQLGHRRRPPCDIGAIAFRDDDDRRQSHAVPGRIQAEDYDLGGENVGYYDTTPGNEGGVYRSDDVDIKASAEGGYAVGWFTSGEWLAYTINVPIAGSYTISARVGSALPGRTFHMEIDGEDVTGPISVPQMADWDQYATVSVANVPLHAGSQTLRVVMGPLDYMDFQWVEVQQ